MAEAPPLDADLLRSAIGPLMMVAQGGQVPTTWGDQTREDAQTVLDAFEDALVELTAEAMERES